MPDFSLFRAFSGKSFRGSSMDAPIDTGLQTARDKAAYLAAEARRARKVEAQTHASSSVLYRATKSLFDFGFSAAVVAVGFVPASLLCVAISAETKGSPIYTQTRVGKNGRLFEIYKFRTMVSDANDLEKYLNEDQIASWMRDRKVKDDPRVTRIGSFLRKTSLDELPQFLNVLKGDLSVIGPRAITKSELEWFGDDVDVLLSMTPGITGFWQIGDRNKASFYTGERQKIELYYVRNANLALDAKIFFKTIQVILMAKGQ